MIKKSVVEALVNDWLEGRDYFLTDLTISADDHIVIEIDHEDGVWIDDCVALSKYVESHLDRDEEDFELEVGSAGIGQPFKVLRQYENHLGKEVEVQTKNGTKYHGILKEVTPEHFLITIEKKIKLPESKRPKIVEEDLSFTYSEVAYTQYLISF